MAAKSYTEALTDEDAMPTGIVKKWLDDRGYGFIAPDFGGSDVFVHVNNITGRPERLEEGQRVRFREAENERSGKSQAVEVEIISMEGMR